MGQARLDYMKDSAWKRGTAKKIDNLPPFELPYAKDAVLIDLVDPDVLPDAQVNFLEMIEVRSTLRQYDDTKALETFLYIRRVEGIKPGLYRFLPLEHKLLLVSDAEDIEEKICSQFSTVGVANNAAVVFLWTAVYERMDCMFGERAYRYIYLDAGHVCQNLYLAAQTMHIKVCALGAFDDEVLNQNLGFDGENQFVVYGAGVGK